MAAENLTEQQVNAMSYERALLCLLYEKERADYEATYQRLSK